MPQPKGSNGPTPRTMRELAALDLIDQHHDLIEVHNALQVVERTAAHCRRRLGTIAARGARAHDQIATAQAREDGTTATPMAQIIAFPARRGPEPPTAPQIARAA